MIKKVLLFFLFVFLSLTSCANNSFINDFNKNSDYHYKFNETYEDLNIVRTHYTLRKSETLTIVFVLPLNANYNYLKQLLETHDEATSVIPFQELGSSVIYYFKQDNNKYTLRKIWSNFGEYKIFGYEAIFEKIMKKLKISLLFIIIIFYVFLSVYFGFCFSWPPKLL